MAGIGTFRIGTPRQAGEGLRIGTVRFVPRGVAKRDKGDLDGAISQFRAAIHATPNYARAHFQLGLALQRKGDKEESAKEFQRAFELDPRLTIPKR